MKFITLFVALLITSVSFAHTYKLSRKIFSGDKVNFLAHAGEGKFDSYQTMNLPFAPAADLFKQIVINQKRPMTTRGEAHITVITPLEFWDVLKPAGITIEEIQQIAKLNNIQESTFEVVCLGMGSKIINMKEEKTFFIVVKSEALIAIRKEIQKLYLSKGGKESFNFEPHITIGYTDRDLHKDDGVTKDETSCIADIDLI